MESTLETIMTKFPFNDLHSFKDFVVFVRMCAPDRFPLREGVPAADQWTLDSAFQAIRTGLSQAVAEKGPRAEFDEFSILTEDAYVHYKAGRVKDGFMALEHANKILKRVQTH